MYFFAKHLHLLTYFLSAKIKRQDPESKENKEIACRCVLEQDTESQIAPDEQVAPCRAASVISV